MPNKNDIVTIEITDITLEGLGVGKTEEGYVLFVPQTAPGDVIKAKILKTLSSSSLTGNSPEKPIVYQNTI